MKRYITMLCTACGHEIEEPVYIAEARRSGEPMVLRVTCPLCDFQFSAAVTDGQLASLPKQRKNVL